MRSGKHRGQKKQKRKGAYDKSGGITHDTAAFAFRTKDILKIRSRPRLEPGSDYHYLVQEETDEPAWYGSWKIIDVKAAAVSALAEEEVEKYKDQTVTYGETTVMVGDTSYEIEGYETMLDVYTQDSMTQDYKADLSDWWNGAGELSFVQVLANDDFFGSVFFATDNGELWIYCDGVFFRAEKAA